MTKDTREDPSGRAGYRSWVNGLRIGVNADDFRKQRGYDLTHPVMQRASSIAANALARGRTPKNTIKLEDITAALAEAGESVEPDVERLRRRIASERYKK